MIESPLACSVRGCGLPLERKARTLVCRRGHAYDVARSGYINLLQPQDRRSRAAGDSKPAVEARSRLLAAGVGRTILDAFVHQAADTDLGARRSVVELGAGGGDTLASLAAVRPVAAVGIDLSISAAEHAARRFPHLTWVVANADRRLPLLDGSVDLILSLHARRNAAECARVLAPARSLLVAVPAHDDLVELRAVVQGRGIERDRADSVVNEHAPWFTLLTRTSTREQHPLERAALLDLLRGTYRGERTSTAARVETLDSLEVTLASEFLLFTRQ